MSLSDLQALIKKKGTQKVGRGTHTMTSRTLEVEKQEAAPAPGPAAATVGGGDTAKDAVNVDAPAGSTGFSPAGTTGGSGWKPVDSETRQRLEQAALLSADGAGEVKDTLREQLFRKERRLRHLMFVGANEGRSLRSCVMPYSGPRYANTNRLCLRSWSVVSRPQLDRDYYFPPELQPLQPGEGETGYAEEQQQRMENAEEEGKEEEKEAETTTTKDTTEAEPTPAEKVEDEKQPPATAEVGSSRENTTKKPTTSDAAGNSPLAPSQASAGAGWQPAASSMATPNPSAYGNFVLAPPASTGYENPCEEALLPEPYHFTTYGRLFEYLHGELLELWNLDDVAQTSRVNIQVSFGMCCLAASNMQRFHHLGNDMPSVLRKIEGENILSNYFIPDTHPILRRAVKEIDFDQRTLKPEHRVQLSIYNKERNNYITVNAKVKLESRSERGKTFEYELQTLETAGVRSVWTIVGLTEEEDAETSSSSEESDTESGSYSRSGSSRTGSESDDDSDDWSSTTDGDGSVSSDTEEGEVKPRTDEKEKRREKKHQSNKMKRKASGSGSDEDAKSDEDDIQQDRQTDAGASTAGKSTTRTHRTRGGRSYVTTGTEFTNRERSGGRDKPFTERRCQGWMAKKRREPYQHGMPFEVMFHCNGEKSLANPCVPFAKCVLAAIADNFERLTEMLLPAVDLSNPPQEGQLDKALQEPTPEILSPVPDQGQVTASAIASFIGSSVRPRFVDLVNEYDEGVKADIDRLQQQEEEEREERRRKLEEEAALEGDTDALNDEPIVQEKAEGEAAEVEDDATKNKPWLRSHKEPTHPLPLGVLTGVGTSKETFETSDFSINKIKIETVYVNKVRGIFVDECTTNIFDYSQTTKQVQAPLALGGDDGAGGDQAEVATLATTFTGEPQLELLPRNILFLREVKIRFPIEGFRSNEANLESFDLVGSLVKYLVQQSKEKRDADIRLSRERYHERKQAENSETGSLYEDEEGMGSPVGSGDNVGGPIVGSRRGGGGAEGRGRGRGATSGKKQSPYEAYDQEAVTHPGSYGPGGRAGFRGGGDRGVSSPRGRGRGRDGNRGYAANSEEDPDFERSSPQQKRVHRNYDECYDEEYDDDDGDYYDYDDDSRSSSSRGTNRSAGTGRPSEDLNRAREQKEQQQQKPHRRYEPGRIPRNESSRSGGSGSSGSRRQDYDDGDDDTRSQRSSISTSSRNSSGRKVYGRQSSDTSSRDSRSSNTRQKADRRRGDGAEGSDDRPQRKERRGADDRDRRDKPDSDRRRSTGDSKTSKKDSADGSKKSDTKKESSQKDSGDRKRKPESDRKQQQRRSKKKEE